ncbi:MAG TPA: SWIM zinc finger family protein [Ilumatobacteraceae bacterium]|nr:SWIM zinc finger family protein [Ilumatobacteraceae bacterium]
MTIVVVPGQFHGQPHAVGKLASTLLSVAVAGMADPARFRRGKGYVAEKAVTRLQISPGRLVANVTGSRESPYQVIVAVATIERPVLGSPEAFRQQINHLTPDANELTVSCTCPDWDDPCKHAVAALLAFANELVVRPELLVEWRSASGGEGEGRARIGSRATRSGERHLRLATPGETNAPQPRPAVSTPALPPAPWETDEWQTFLGTQPPQPPPVPAEPSRVGQATLGSIDLGTWLRSALEQLADQ